jgi:hypothetical protein
MRGGKRFDRLADVPVTTLEIGRNFLAAGLIVAGTVAGALAVPQEEAIPTFGTTVVVPGGLLGVIYAISPFSKFLPYFQSLDPLGVIYISTLNVTPRNFLKPVRVVRNRLLRPILDRQARAVLFELTSDDDQSVVDNAGIRPPETRTGELTRGIIGFAYRISRGRGMMWRWCGA